MKKFIKFNCPYCDFVNNLLLSEGKHLITCDLDEGGCDKDLMIKVNFKVEYELYFLSRLLKQAGTITHVDK